jgi:uncharacterized protein YlxW (UPF0749 family)
MTGEGEKGIRPAEGPERGTPAEQPSVEEQPVEEPGPAQGAADEPREAEPGANAGQPVPAETLEDAPAADAPPPRRRRDPLASTLIGLLTLLLGFAFAVQVRATDTPEQLESAREEDLVRILDELNTSEERLRAQIAEQREALEELTSSDSQSAAALAEAQEVAESIGILNGTVEATGPGITMSIRDPADEVRVADLLDAIQELRGAGAETMQIDDVRVGVSTAVTGNPGALLVDGRPISAPYEFVVIGDPQNLETALNIPGGVVQRIANRGGTAVIERSDRVEVDALRPLDEPQYASPETDG